MLQALALVPVLQEDPLGITPLAFRLQVAQKKRYRLQPNKWNRDFHSKAADSQVDLSTKGEIVLRDKGYFGMQAKRK